MRVLILKWNCFGYNYLVKAFKELGHEVIELDFPQDKGDSRNGEELAVLVLNGIQNNKVDAVVSLNYFPVAAIAAAAAKVKYISWTYDSPYIQLYSKTIELPTNYAFVFDKAEYYNLCKRGVNTVYYLPMAADVEHYDSITLSDAEKKHYKTDVAMVGSMYSESKHDLIRHFEGLDEYTRGYLAGVMDAQKQIYGASILESSLTEDVVKNIQKVCPMYASGDGLETAAWTLANYFVARKLTSIERYEMIKKISEEFDMALYTPEKTPLLTKVRNQGTVEYYKDSAKAIKSAKINLNISLRSIITGIPLRCFDIMGAGGFLLTNYQADFDELFENGVDYVYFENQEDLLDKIQYYLTHEEERIAIAKKGYEKVKMNHTYVHRVKEMMSVAFD